MHKRLPGEPEGFWRSVLWYMGHGPQEHARERRIRERTLREVIGSDLDPHNPCHDRVRERLEAKLKASADQ